MFKGFKTKFKDLIKKRWAYVLSIVFIWIIPIIMLNEKVALTQTGAGFKVTFMGCIVILVVFLAFRKKIYAWINRKSHGLTRGILLSLSKAITYGLFLGVLWAVSHFSNLLYHWWLLCGISWLIGLVLIMVDEHFNSKPKEKDTNENE